MSSYNKKVLSVKISTLIENLTVPVGVVALLKYLVDLSSAPERGKDPFWSRESFELSTVVDWMAVAISFSLSWGLGTDGNSTTLFISSAYFNISSIKLTPKS